MTTRALLFSALALLCCPAPTRAGVTKAEGFDRETEKRDVPMGQSKNSDGKVALHCHIYPEFAIAHIVDPGIKGARLELRPNKKGTTPAALCDPKAKEKVVVVDDELGEFVGVVGKYIVTESVDGLGLVSGFAIWSAPDGKKLFESTHDASAGLRVVRKGKKVGLEFRHTFTAPCPLASEKGCWDKVVREHRIPAAIKQPDCRASFAAQKAPLTGNADLSLPARIDDLASPQLKLLPGQAECAPQP